MALKDKLTQQGSPLSKANGGDIPVPVGATRESLLHYEYSVSGDPNQISKPEPSTLDLNGKTPSNSYKNTAPVEGLGNI